MLMLRAVVSGTLLSSKVAAATGVIAALAALTRPDGMIYVFAFPIVVALFIRRPTVGCGTAGCRPTSASAQCSPGWRSMRAAAPLIFGHTAGGEGD
jgi:hypothetical protein